MSQPIPKPIKYNKAEDQRSVKLAALLDQHRCQWCFFKKGGWVVATGPPHHLFRKRKRWDLDAIISLCVECHHAVHIARQVNGETEITREKLAQLMEERVIPARKLVARRLELET